MPRAFTSVDPGFAVLFNAEEPGPFARLPVSSDITVTFKGNSIQPKYQSSRNILRSHTHHIMMPDIH